MKESKQESESDSPWLQARGQRAEEFRLARVAVFVLATPPGLLYNASEKGASPSLCLIISQGLVTSCVLRLC